MKQNNLVCALFGILLMASSLFAGTTGKITGVITDAKTKEPLVGVSVAVEGTTLGAKTDADGRYTILNVPVGTYVLKFSSVGYTTVEISNVSVSVDLASYQDQPMSQSVTELGNVIQITAEAPLLIKDKTSSISVIKKDDIEALPVRGLDQVVAMQNSVVKTRSFSAKSVRGDREAVNGTELNIRGGRASDVEYVVDGFSTRDPLTGQSTAKPPTGGVKEVSVQSGGFNAEYGSVSSGVINTTTLSGGELLTGSLDAYTDDFQKRSSGASVYEGTLNGPIPLAEKLYFALDGQRWWVADRSQSSQTSSVLPSKQYGLPNNSAAGWAYSAKLDYNITPNVKATLSNVASREEWREYTHSYLFNQAHMPYYEDRNFGVNGRLTHTLSSKSFYNLSGSYSQIKRFRGDGVYKKNLFGYERAVNPNYDAAALFWNAGHVYDDFLRHQANYFGFNGDFTSQVGEFHTLKLGLSAQRYALRFYQNLFPVQIARDSTANLNDINRYGYDEFGNSTNDDGLDGAKHPVEMSAFIQDRFEWRGMIINGGLRFDYFDYKAKRIKDLSNPFDPDNKGGALSTVLDESDLENSEKFTRLSPRLGISFPVSDKSKLHLNYVKLYQRPDLGYLYVGYKYYEYHVYNGGYYYPIGNPNLKPEQTTSYEVGFEHLMNDRTRLAVTAFLKDLTDLVQVYSQAANPRSYATFQNTDYGTIKGLEFELEMRRTRNVQLDIKYTLMYATGTGSYATTARNAAWTDGDAPKQPSALDYDQRHKLTANFDWQLGRGQGPLFGSAHPLENTRLVIVANAASGAPYSPQTTYNEVTLANVSPTPAAPRNSSYGPWTFSIDLRLSREFKIGRYAIKPYLEVYNLLDRDNVTFVYESSGRANSTGFLATPEGQDFISRNSTPGTFGYTGESEYLLKESDPTNYSIPRQIFFGVQASF